MTVLVLVSRKSMFNIRQQRALDKISWFVSLLQSGRLIVFAYCSQNASPRAKDFALGQE